MITIDKLLVAETELAFFVLLSRIHWNIYGKAELTPAGALDEPYLLIKIRAFVTIPSLDDRPLSIHKYISNFRLYPDQRLEWDILDYTYDDPFHPEDERIVETIVGLDNIQARLHQMQQNGQGLLIASGDSVQTRVESE